MIRVYNTLSKTKEPFEPVHNGKVGIYLCGPTVYKPSHIGHMVGPVIFDTIKRYLSYNGYEVRLIINITDVDDKLIVESKKRGISMDRLAEEMTRDYMANLRAMGIDTIDEFPKATENMAGIIAFTQDLIDKGFAYVSEGDVYFDVAKAPDYGKLSHRTLESMQGEGGDTAERKRSQADFALWKTAKPGEPSWERTGPAGLAHRVLGDERQAARRDVRHPRRRPRPDLPAPRKRNRPERVPPRQTDGQVLDAQRLDAGLERDRETGRAAHARTEGDNVAQEAGKISKSKGASPFSEMLKQFAPETIRFFLLSTHYRRPIDFSEERIRQVGVGLETFYRFFKRFERVSGESFYRLDPPRRRSDGDFQPGEDRLLKDVAELRDRFLEAMDDDFNTGGAAGVLFDLVRRLNKFVDDEKLEEPGRRDKARLASLRQGAATLGELAGTLGMFRNPPEEKSSAGDELAARLMELLIEIRAEARKAKDFATADRIRKSLAEIGVTLEDRPGGTDWTIG